MRQSIFIVLLALVTAALPSIGPVEAQSESERLEGVVRGEGFRPIPVAVPAGSPSEAARKVHDEIVEAIRYDLDFSVFFDLVDPNLYGLVPKRQEATPVYDDWRSIGAEAMLDLVVDVDGDQIDVVMRLYDVVRGKLLLNYRYGGGPDLLRRIAHQVSDDIVLQFTGRPGIALTWIAFSSKHGDGKELYLMDYDGRRVRRLTSTSTLNITPAWSPTGNVLSFMSWREKQPAIYLLDGDGNLTRAPSLASEMSAAPDWSPDGSRLVYSGDAAGNLELYLLDLATGRNDRLTRTAAIEMAPAFSPTGREIAFTSNRSGSPQIYIMDAEGLNVRRVSFEGSYNDSAAWSPDGDRLAYVSRIDGKFHVMVLDLASNRTRRITFGNANHENPRWSPDGHHIVFASDRLGTYDIYTMRSDGSRITRLTKGGDCYTPDWSRFNR